MVVARFSRFLPVLISSGHVIMNGKAISADGEAMMSHAIQGMRPNLVRRPIGSPSVSQPPRLG
jgi:hypothetical protein